jgi:Glutathione S-transferase, N-terminal domain
MQLIGMLDSPYVRRVAIALIIAKTPFIHRPISLFRHIDQFSKFNRLLKAPTLLTDDGVTLMAVDGASTSTLSGASGNRSCPDRHGKSGAAPI